MKHASFGYMSLPKAKMRNKAEHLKSKVAQSGGLASPDPVRRKKMSDMVKAAKKMESMT